IPFQSGDTDVIRSMNRKGSSEDYINLVKSIRQVFPESAIRTTFLTGFPGETEEAALNTRNFLKAIESDWSGCFTYSREDDTPAAKMKGRVPKKIAAQRERQLQEIQTEITERHLKARTGKVYDVLIEEVVENQSGGDDGFAIGRAWFQAPEIDGSVVVHYDLDDQDAVKAIVPGAMVKVNVFASSQVDVDGEYCGA
ncbi:MAG: 30S ribosomal protein S12 methylthiotransferase RimO, partial [Treponema sp.]|nr:30S ribosomal protein S12 methylthiotransferase RimO [Treponema sp.]